MDPGLKGPTYMTIISLDRFRDSLLALHAKLDISEPLWGNNRITFCQGKM